MLMRLAFLFVASLADTDNALSLLQKQVALFSASDIHPGLGNRCVVARFPKAAGCTLAHMVHNDPHVKMVREYGALRSDHFSTNSFVIGQTRHPLEWYASLWSYLSDGNGPVSDGGGRRELRKVLSTETPHGATLEDKDRFRAFVRYYTTPEIGAFSLHFWLNYIDLGNHVRDGAKKVMGVKDSPRWHSHLLQQAASELAKYMKRPESGHRVKCWVRQENLFSSFQQCLTECENTLNANVIDWTNLQSMQDTVANPSTERVPLSSLYDDATRKLVAARDRHMFAFFGYDPVNTTLSDLRLWTKPGQPWRESGTRSIIGPIHSSHIH